MEIQDDRTPEQKKTHTVLVVMTDRFLSGWGRASGGASVAAWACGTSQEVTDAERWVSGRSDALRVRTVYDSPRRYRPRSAAHFHVYVWTAR
jgi:hypothetical protein